MTNAWFLGASESVPQSEMEARSTVEPIRDDNVTAEAQDAPDWNEYDTDESGELVGLSPRMVGSDTHDSERYGPWWARLATEPHNIIVDRQVATSGTAAAREDAGQQGHGTMQYAVGIEPQIREGARYGNDYFVTDEKDIQEGMGAYMQPETSDHWAAQVAASRGTQGSRKAFEATLYSRFLGG